MSNIKTEKLLELYKRALVITEYIVETKYIEEFNQKTDRREYLIDAEIELKEIKREIRELENEREN